MYIQSKFLKTFTAFLLALAISCSGDDRGGKSGSKNYGWAARLIVFGNCHDEEYPQIVMDTSSVNLTADTISISLNDLKITMKGLITGNSFSCEGSSPEKDGTKSITINGIISEDETTISGNADWTWTNDDYSCYGTAEVLIKKLLSEEADISGKWSGRWESPKIFMSGSFTAYLEQEDSDLGGTFLSTDLVMEEPVTGTVNGNSITFGDINNMINFSGYACEDGSTFGVYTYTQMNDLGIWEATLQGTGTLTVIDTINIPVEADPQGLAFDGTNLWFSDNFNYKIYEIDLSGNIQNSFDCPVAGSGPQGLAFDGAFLWHADWFEEKIYKLDTAGNVQSSFPSPGCSPTGLACDGAYIWNSDLTNKIIYQIDTHTGVILSYFNSPASMPTGLAFDGIYLWSADDSIMGQDKIFKMDTSGNIITEYNSPVENTSGLAFDGAYLWCADSDSERLYKLKID